MWRRLAHDEPSSLRRSDASVRLLIGTLKNNVSIRKPPDAREIVDKRLGEEEISRGVALSHDYLMFAL